MPDASAELLPWASRVGLRVLDLQHPYPPNLTRAASKAGSGFDVILDHGGECAARPRMCPSLRIKRMQEMWPWVKPGGF